MKSWRLFLLEILSILAQHMGLHCKGSTFWHIWLHNRGFSQQASGSTADNSRISPCCLESDQHNDDWPSNIFNVQICDNKDATIQILQVTGVHYIISFLAPLRILESYFSELHKSLWWCNSQKIQAIQEYILQVHVNIIN